MELLKYGSEVEVLEPQSLIGIMKGKLEQMKRLYQ
jgi:predicted DNA-binding transcriptional regulator YafY